MSEDQVEAIEIREIVITAPDAEWLATFCRSLIDDRLAAAAHIIEDIRTVYRWKDAVQDTHEARAHIRTRRALADAILQRVESEHPYEIPSVVMLDVSPLSPRYRTWVEDQTAETPRIPPR